MAGNRVNKKERNQVREGHSIARGRDGHGGTLAGCARRFRKDRIMRATSLAAAALLLGLMATSARAQAPTTVQLPTFRFFTVQTTVSVPDRGSASLGGITRSSSSSTWRGVPGLRGSRSLASGRDAGGVSVHATIIDHAELDRAVLAAARRSSGAAKSATSAKADFISRNVGRTGRQ
jgi:hypothetical protein